MWQAGTNITKPLILKQKTSCLTYYLLWQVTLLPQQPFQLVPCSIMPEWRSPRHQNRLLLTRNSLQYSSISYCKAWCTPSWPIVTFAWCILTARVLQKSQEPVLWIFKTCGYMVKRYWISYGMNAIGSVISALRGRNEASNTLCGCSRACAFSSLATIRLHSSVLTWCGILFLFFPLYQRAHVI